MVFSKIGLASALNKHMLTVLISQFIYKDIFDILSTVFIWKLKLADEFEKDMTMTLLMSVI